MIRPCIILIIVIGSLGAGVTAAWSANSCVDCHKQAETLQTLPSWYQDQYLHWYGSIHGQKGVTCEKCHGGDSSQMDKKLAHQGVVPASDSKSPVYYTNVPETCGACHKKVYQQFVQSRHYKNLKSDRLAPTCTTCHGLQMDIGAVMPLQLAGRCPICHNPQKGVKPEVAELARKTLEEVTLTDRSIQKAQAAIELAREQGQKPADAEQRLKTARVRLKMTGAMWHSFRLNEFNRELKDIQGEVAKAFENAKRSLMKP